MSDAEEVSDHEIQVFVERAFGLRAKREHVCAACKNVVAIDAPITTMSKGDVWHRSCASLPRPSRRVILLEERRKERARQPEDERQGGLFEAER